MRDDELTCPSCGALPGQRCRTAIGLPAAPHAARVEAACDKYFKQQTEERADMNDREIVPLKVLKAARNELEHTHTQDPIKTLARTLCILLAGFLDVAIEEEEKQT